LLLRLLLLRGGCTNHRAERKAKHRPTDRGTAVIIVAITVIIAPGCRRFQRSPSRAKFRPSAKSQPRIYLDAWASADGTVHYRPDVYGLDGTGDGHQTRR
jgi:hypothetical protein